MKTLKTVLIGFVAALGFFVGNATFTAHAAGLGFTVETPMPKNQIKGTDAYYNLLLAPDAKQTVNAKLVNKTKEPIKVKISAQTAITNSNGVIDYASNQKNTEKSLQYSLQDTVKVPAEVTIPASGSIKVPITMHMPAGKLKGVMAGGIFFRQVNADTEQSSENSVAIVNQYAFTTALLMRQSKKIYQPNLALQSVNASQINLRNVISLNLVNEQPAFLNHLEINSKIMKQGTNQVAYHTRSQNLQMAPNTQFSYPIRLEDKKLVSGSYTAHVTAFAMPDKNGRYQNADGQKFAEKWTFTKDFTITNKEADDLNRKSIATTHYPWWLYAAAGVVALLVILLIVTVTLLLKRNKKTK